LAHLLDATVELINKARLLEKKGKHDDAAFLLGTALHYMHDSYTPSHATRNEAGEITRFQEYNAQSPTLHGNADVLNQNDPDFKAHVDRSVKLLEVYANSQLTGEALRNHLKDNFYQISDGAQAGKTEGGYAPRK